MTLLELARERLSGNFIQCVDAGARNGTFELSDLAPLVDVLGFEPNPEEYRKLVSGDTDLARATGHRSPEYHSISYSDAGLHDREGEADLFVTRGPGACSVLSPNQEAVARFQSMLDGVAPFAPTFDVMRKEKVRVASLAHVAGEKGIAHIDYLKLDTQGNEFEILQGAADLLQSGKVAVIKTEVEFMPLYRGQKLFSDIDLYLRSFGFDLLDIVFTREHRLTSHRVSPPGDKGTLFYGDAVYAYACERWKDPRAALRQAFVLGSLGYKSLALRVAEQAAGLGPAEIEALAGALSHKPLREVLTQKAKGACPPAAVPLLKGIARRLRLMA